MTHTGGQIDKTRSRRYESPNVDKSEIRWGNIVWRNEDKKKRRGKETKKKEKEREILLDTDWY